jgi:hypothetical protein
MGTLTRILPTAAACVLLLTVSCARAPASQVELRERVDFAAAAPPVDVGVVIQKEHAPDAARFLRAAVASVKLCGSWFGAFGSDTLTLIDPVWRIAPLNDQENGAITLEPVHWWTTPTSMAPELAAARGVVRRLWTTAVDTSALPAWLTDGLVEFGARRVVAPIFEQENNPPGYAFLETRFFGGFVPRFVRIRLPPETDGDHRTHAGKTVLALGTLERWLGRPVFDQVLAQFVATSRGRAPQLADFERTASEVSGQSLSWFFDQVFHATDEIDYGVGQLASERSPDGTFVSTVTARRYGEGVFPGASAPPIGPFESGRGVTMLVTFADGQRRLDQWDGRNREKTFRYRSQAPAVSAVIDPNKILLLDVKQTNNSRTLTPQSAAAAWHWAGRWMAWLENALLNYAVFV